jgi:predicted CopG family antitoxin
MHLLLLYQKRETITLITKVSTVMTTASSERRKRLKLKRIVISERNYFALKELGHAGDSFNDVISKLLRIERSYQEMKKQHKQESLSDNSSNNSDNNGFLFPQSPTEIFNKQNRQQLDELIRSLQNRSRSND